MIDAKTVKDMVTQYECVVDVLVKACNAARKTGTLAQEYTYAETRKMLDEAIVIAGR